MLDAHQMIALKQEQQPSRVRIGSRWAVRDGTERTRRVAYVTTSMGVGGAERLLVEIINRMDRTHYEPLLVCLKDPDVLGDQLADSGVRVHAHLSRHLLDPGLLGRLVNVLRREAVDVVCTVGTGGDRSFWGRLAARWAGVPVVVSCPHSMGVPDRFEPHNRLLNAITDAYIATAHLQKRYLVKSEGLPTNKIHVVYTGVDLRRFRPGVAYPKSRSELGIPSSAPLAGVVACLRPEKNLEMFLRAAQIVHRQLPAAHFVIVGDGPERDQLESLAESLDLRRSVHFAGQRDHVQEWIGAMDLVALTSLCEAFPVSLLEAMACGKPVVTTDVGAIAEMVVPGLTGLVVPPGDHHALAAAVCQILSDPVKSRQMGASGRKHVEDNFDVNHMVRGYERLFDRLLQEASA